MCFIAHQLGPFNSLQQGRQYWWKGEWKDSLLSLLFCTSQMNSVIKLPLVMTANWIKTIGLDTAHSYSEGREGWVTVGNTQLRKHNQVHTRKHSQRRSSLLNGTSGGLAEKAVAHFFLLFSFSRKGPLHCGCQPFWLRALHISRHVPWRPASLALHPDLSPLSISQTTVC